MSLKTTHDGPPREVPAPGSVIVQPVPYAERRAVWEASMEARDLARRLAERIGKWKKPPDWLSKLSGELLARVQIVEAYMGTWAHEGLTAEQSEGFRPSHVHMLGYVALLLVFVIVYTTRAPTVDLSTPCLAYNVVAAEHELELKACDPWGQFDFPQSAAEIEATLDELNQLEGAANGS